jgi:hypothetical protein
MTKSTSLLLFLAWAALGAGCAAEPPPVPLYPNAAAQPRSPAEVATVEGPLQRIDGQDVNGQGGRFALLPGCHLVDLDQQASANNYSLSGGVYLTGQLQKVSYALRMKPGARYVIRRDTVSGEMQSVRIVLSAREELPGGATSDLDPIKSGDDIQACKAWEATQGH